MILLKLFNNTTYKRFKKKKKHHLSVRTKQLRNVALVQEWANSLTGGATKLDGGTHNASNHQLEPPQNNPRTTTIN